MDEARRERIGRAADRVAVLAAVGLTGYAALGTNVFGKTPWPETMVDYHLLYELSRHVVAHNAYPPGYPYPPPAVLLHYATAQFPFPVSAALYLVLTMAAALACWWVLLRLLRLERRPGGTAVGLLALVPSAYYFVWDLKSQNCNILFLLALLLGVYSLAGGRPRRAGFWLALSVSLKLFSGLLIPYVLWTGQRRAFAWALAFLGLFWVVLPVLVFGYPGAVEVYGSWLEQMRTVAADRADWSHPILISLHNSAAWLAAHRGPAAAFTLNAVRAAWLGLALAALAASWRRASAPGDAFGLLADVGLLTLAPIALSPYLEPYHPVPIAIPAALLAAAADRRQHPRLRLVAVSFLAATCAVGWCPKPWQLRGLVVNACLLLAIAGAVAVAWLRRPAAVAAGE